MNPKRPLLTELMLACHTGACNTYALINALSKAMSAELQPHEVRGSLEVQYIIGHIAFQTDNTLGPNPAALEFAFAVNSQVVKDAELKRIDDHNRLMAAVFPEQQPITSTPNTPPEYEEE